MTRQQASLQRLCDLVAQLVRAGVVDGNRGPIGQVDHGVDVSGPEVPAGVGHMEGYDADGRAAGLHRDHHPGPDVERPYLLTVVIVEGGCVYQCRFDRRAGHRLSGTDGISQVADRGRLRPGGDLPHQGLLDRIDVGMDDRLQPFFLHDHHRAGVGQLGHEQPGDSLDGRVEIERRGQLSARLGHELLTPDGPFLGFVQAGPVESLSALMGKGGDKPALFIVELVMTRPCQAQDADRATLDFQGKGVGRGRLATVLGHLGLERPAGSQGVRCGKLIIQRDAPPTGRDFGAVVVLLHQPDRLRVASEQPHARPIDGQRLGDHLDDGPGEVVQPLYLCQSGRCRLEASQSAGAGLGGSSLAPNRFLDATALRHIQQHADYMGGLASGVPADPDLGVHPAHVAVGREQPKVELLGLS